MTLLLPVAVVPQSTMMPSPEPPMVTVGMPQQQQLQYQQQQQQQQLQYQQQQQQPPLQPEPAAQPALPPPPHSPMDVLLSGPAFAAQLPFPGPGSPLVPPSGLFGPSVPQPTAPHLTLPLPPSAFTAPLGSYLPQAAGTPPPAAASATRRPQHVSLSSGPLPGAVLPGELPDLARSILTSLDAWKRDSPSLPPSSLVPPVPQRQIPAAPTAEGEPLAHVLGTEIEAEQTPLNLSSVAGLSLDTKPPQRRSHNMQHERDRAFLDMLRNLHNASC
eukprot:EG_transcript_14948